MDSDSCSLSTKIHYAQIAGVKLLLIKYVDDGIKEAEVDRSSFSGVKIPVLLVKDSAAGYIYEVLRSVDGENNKMVIDLKFHSSVDRQQNKIQVFMTASVVNNPMIVFLRDMLNHHHLLRKYELEIKYVIGQCVKCKKKNFLERESGCYSGGRYCIIDTDFK